MNFENEAPRGAIFYGMHFYPGVADYQEPFKGRLFVNEKTIRSMDATFQGCPVFVRHVDEVEQDIDKLRADADGWVIESFFNAADGKHWVKFIVVSEKGEEAIRQGYKLSNSYEADKLGGSGIWNDVPYDAELLEGRFEHLALVPVPRYNESVILTPEKYKQYCNEREEEVKRISNSGEQKPMALSFFKRAKVENGADFENTMVVLPKSKKERTILQLVNDADAHEMRHGMAHPDHLVDMGEGHKMSVKDLSNAYKAMCESAKEHATQNDDDKKDEEDAHKAEGTMVAKNDDDDDTADKSAPITGGNDSDVDMDNEEGLEEKKMDPIKEEPDAEKAKKDTSVSGPRKNNASDVAKAAAKRAEDKAKAAKLKNAGPHNTPEVAHVNFAMDQVARGKQKYGSG